MPVSLEELVLDGHVRQPHAFTGGIPAGWASLTNLKKLSMARCGLDGEWMIQIIHDQRIVPRSCSPDLCPFSWSAGQIPPGFGNLTNLEELNLFHNALSGMFAQNCG